MLGFIVSHAKCYLDKLLLFYIHHHFHQKTSSEKYIKQKKNVCLVRDVSEAHEVRFLIAKKNEG